MRFVVTLDERKDKLAVAVCKAAGRNKKKLLLKLIESYLNQSEIDDIEYIRNCNIFELNKDSKANSNQQLIQSLNDIVDSNKQIAEAIKGMVLSGSTINNESNPSDNHLTAELNISKSDKDSLPDNVMENLLGNIDID